MRRVNLAEMQQRHRRGQGQLGRHACRLTRQGDESRRLSKDIGDDAFPNGREREHEGGFGEVPRELLVEGVDDLARETQLLMLCLDEAHEALRRQGVKILVVIPTRGWVNLTQSLHDWRQTLRTSRRKRSAYMRVTAAVKCVFTTAGLDS